MYSYIGAGVALRKFLNLCFASREQRILLVYGPCVLDLSLSRSKMSSFVFCERTLMARAIKATNAIKCHYPAAIKLSCMHFVYARNDKAMLTG